MSAIEVLEEWKTKPCVKCGCVSVPYEKELNALDEALLALEQKDKKNFTKQELSIFLRLIKNEINNLGDIYSTTTKEQLKVFRKIRQEYTNIELKLIKELEEGVEK